MKTVFQNLFEEPKRAGVEKGLVDLLQELGFTCEKGLSESNRVCSKCSMKIRHAVHLMMFLRSLKFVRQASLSTTENEVELSSGNIFHTFWIVFF